LKVDLYIIKLLLIYNNIYNTYYKYININNIKTNNKLLYKVYLCLRLLKEKFPKEYHTVDDLRLIFITEYPVVSKEEHAQFEILMGELDALEVSTEDKLILEYLSKYKLKELSEQIAVTALDVSQGRKDKEELHALYKEFVEGTDIRTEDADKRVLDCTLSDEVSDFLGNPGVRWRLKTLNKILGSLRRGNFGFLFARPEIGKTTFLASEGSFMAAQLDGPLLHFNNEEADQQVMLRYHQAALGWTKDQVLANVGEARERFQAATKGNIKLIGVEYCNKKDAEAICKEYNPRLLIFDQLDKMGGFDAERNDLKLKGIYQWARELGKVYGPSIGVCQAGGTAENKRYLTMNDVDSSHTAKQGEADWVLGIGADHDNEFIRYLSLCKNKLPGDEDTDPNLRHARVEVSIAPHIARYEDRMF
jgi:hypothetical protein